MLKKSMDITPLNPYDIKLNFSFFISERVFWPVEKKVAAVLANPQNTVVSEGEKGYEYWVLKSCEGHRIFTLSATGRYVYFCNIKEAGCYSLQFSKEIVAKGFVNIASNRCSGVPLDKKLVVRGPQLKWPLCQYLDQFCIQRELIQKIV